MLRKERLKVVDLLLIFGRCSALDGISCQTIRAATAGELGQKQRFRIIQVGKNQYCRRMLLKSVWNLLQGQANILKAYFLPNNIPSFWRSAKKA
jgi:hypothetical protein